MILEKDAFINNSSTMLVENIIIRFLLKPFSNNKKHCVDISLKITDHLVETLHSVQLLKLHEVEVSLQLHRLDQNHHIPLECLDP